MAALVLFGFAQVVLDGCPNYGGLACAIRGTFGFEGGYKVFREAAINPGVCFEVVTVNTGIIGRSFFGCHCLCINSFQ